MATVRYLGTAEDTPDVYTITIANTWASTDAVTVTIGGDASLVVTLGTTATTTHVAEALSKAFNAKSRSDNLSTAADESRNTGGQVIPQFTELTASYSGSVVTLVGPNGIPCTVAVAESTAGTGTATLATVQSATGRWHWNNGDNWSGGSAPANGDDVWFDAGAVDCRYGLPNGSLQPNSIHGTMDYTGKIGLPSVNRQNPNAVYREYRQRYVTLDDDATDSFVTIEWGLTGTGQGSPMANFDWSGNTTVTIDVKGTGKPIDGVSGHALNIKGNAFAMVPRIDRGHVALAPDPGDTTVITNTTIGYVNNATSDARVFYGPDATISGSVYAYGGYFESECAFSSADIYMYAGVGKVRPYSTEITSLNVYSPAVCDIVGTGTIGTLNLSGTLNNRGGSAVFTNTAVTSGAKIVDPIGSFQFTNGIDFTQCGTQQTDIEWGKHFTLTKSAI